MTRRVSRPRATSVTAAVADQLHQLAKVNLRQHQRECATCGVQGADVLHYCEHGYRLAQAVQVTRTKASGNARHHQGRQAELWG